MGIEITTYCPKLRRRKTRRIASKSLCPGGCALRDRLQNEPEIDLPLAISQYSDDLEPESVLEQPPVIPLPASWALP
jgi:hypothetical protein